MSPAMANGLFAARRVGAGPAVVSPGTSVVAADAKATCVPSPFTAG